MLANYTLLARLFLFCQEKQPISTIDKPYTTVFLEFDNISLKAKSPGLAFLSFALPGVGTSIITDGKKGKKKIKTSLSVLAIGALSKLISDSSYEKYQNSTEYSSGNNNADSSIESNYNTANFLNDVFIYSGAFYFTLGLHDTLRAFFKAKKAKKEKEKLNNL